MDNHLHAAYATDNRYVMYTGISMYSLFDRNKDFEEITIHILDTGISEERKRQLKEISDSFHREIVFYDCSAIGEWLGADIVEMFNKEDTNVPISSYARLFLPELVDESIEKMLYLDADSIITGSYSKLWMIDNSNFSVMGVIDNVSEDAKRRVGLSDDYRYINAGVLLMNFNLMRKMNFTNLAKEFIAEHKGYVYHHDQGIINGVLHDTVGYLPLQYNMMSFMFETKNIADTVEKYEIKSYYSSDELIYAQNNLVYIHFTEGYLQRPWIKGCKHPLRKEWMYYRDKTIWKNTPLLKDKRSMKLKLLANINLYMPMRISKFIMNYIRGLKK